MPLRSPFHLALCLLLLTGISGASHAQNPAPEPPSGWTDRKPVSTRHWMVAAANPLAVNAGYDILKAGGNAVDAAIAVQLVLNVVEPQSSGVGGGAFMLYHDAGRHHLVAYDGRETAPAAATPERFLDAAGRPLQFHDAVIGGKSVGVPGTLALLYEAHRRHGKLAWSRLFDRAIELADKGFAVSPRLAALLASEPFFIQPRIREIFLDAQGRALRSGALLRNPALASTFRKVAAQGPIAFYRGEIARDIVDTVRSAPRNAGDMTLADLERYRVKIRTPVCGAYRMYKVCGMPLPSSGGLTVLQMLGILEPYDIAGMGPASFWSVHFISEAGRLAYADRDAYMADPDFYTPPAGLVDRAYLRARSRLIRTDASMGNAEPGTPAEVHAPRNAEYAAHGALEFASTSHISIVDGQGNAVAMTTTIEDSFGSRLMTRSGFLLNNELTDFSFVPVQDGKPVANRVQPGKRPRSAMAPTIVYDHAGRVFMVAGSPGGPAIINYVVKALVAVIDWQLDPQAAAALPNFGSRNGPTELEAHTSVVELQPKLEALGHRIRVTPETSGLHLIVRTRSGWTGGADPRREGEVRGE